MQADKVVLTLAGTENRVTDSSGHAAETAAADEPRAAIFGEDDLTINGGGSLAVVAGKRTGPDLRSRL